MRVPAQSRAIPNVFNAGNVVKQLIWTGVFENTLIASLVRRFALPDVTLPESEPDLEAVTSGLPRPSRLHRGIVPARRSLSCAPPSGRPRADLRSPAVARCCGPGAKAPHAKPPPSSRPPARGAEPPSGWDSAVLP